jgi:plasmid maintenance system killer protein
VQVEFRTNRLRACSAKSSEGAREWGEKVGRKYIDRVNVLKHAKSADDLHAIAPLRFHVLKGDRQGQHSITLIGRWRMVVTFRDDALTIVRVEEVSQHYGD